MKIYIYVIMFLLLGCNNKKQEIIYYENGNIKSKGFFINELKSGEYIEYYENGNIKLKGSYDKGNRIGTFYQYYKNAKLSSITNFRDGKKEGLSYEFHPSSPLKIINCYHKDSMITQELIDTLRKQRISYLEGDRSIDYYENGKIKMIINGWKDKTKYYKLVFSPSGKLESKEGNLNFISKEDSIELR